MSNKTLLRSSLMGLAAAAAAASLLTVSGAFDAPQSARNTPSGKLATVCSVPYDKAVFAELQTVFSKQAIALNRVGLGETKADVCTEVNKVANGKANPKTDAVEYGNTAYYARAVLGAAVLYRTNAVTLDKAMLQDMGAAFGAEGKQLARWIPGKATPAMIKDAGVAFIGGDLAMGGKSDIDSSSLKNPKFASYVYDLNISP